MVNSLLPVYNLQGVYKSRGISVERNDEGTHHKIYEKSEQYLEEFEASKSRLLNLSESIDRNNERIEKLEKELENI